MFRVPSVIVRRLFEPAWDVYESSVRLKTYRKLLQSQWFAGDELATLRQSGLRSLLEHARDHCPFWQRRLTETGIDPDRVHSIEDLRQLPVLTKDDIRQNLDDMLSRKFDRNKLLHAKTGGSTGVSLVVYRDIIGAQMRAAAGLRSDNWAGWNIGEPVAAVWGNPPGNHKLRSKIRHILKDRKFYLDTMKIDAAAMDAFVTEWHRWRPGLIYGHSHSLFILAEYMLEKGIKLTTGGVVATSMMLIESERKVIEHAFAKPVTNRYGCEELSLIACECELHDGLHINAEHVIVEFLRDDGTPSNPGENGRIVVTELVNYGMPLIRYDVGDWGVPSNRKCDCGRGLPLMESVTGRLADFLLATDNTRVSGISLIENTLTRFPGIKQLQFIQEGRQRLTVNLVPTVEYRQDTSDGLVRILHDSLVVHTG